MNGRKQCQVVSDKEHWLVAQHTSTKEEVDMRPNLENCQAQPQLQLNLWLRLFLFLE